jgi:hypothetical protein
MRIYSVSRRAQGGLNLIRQSRRHRQAATPKVSTRSRWPGDLSTAPEDEPSLEPVTRASGFFFWVKVQEVQLADLSAIDSLTSRC